MKLAKLINIRNKNGNFSAEEMIFNSETHFDNWVKKSIDGGLNIVGIFDLALEIPFKKYLTNEQFYQIALIENKGTDIEIYLGNPENYSFDQRSDGELIKFKSNADFNFHVIMLKNQKLIKWTSLKRPLGFYNSKQIQKYLETL